MSLISDALKKVQRESDRHSSLQVAPLNRNPHSRPSRRGPPVRQISHPLIVANIATLVLLAGAAVFFFERRLPNPSPAPIASAPVVTLPAPPPASTPFIPPPSLAPAPKAVSIDYDLAGTTTLGKDTLLGVTRRSDKHSVWIPVGKTVGEITAVSYDAGTDRAILRVEGRLITIAMRNGLSAPDSPPHAQATE